MNKQTALPAFALVATACILGWLSSRTDPDQQLRAPLEWPPLPDESSLRSDADSITRSFALIRWPEASGDPTANGRRQSMDAFRLIAIMGGEEPRALIASEGGAPRSSKEGDILGEGIRLSSIRANEIELMAQDGCRRVMSLPARHSDSPSTVCPAENP